MIRVLVLGGYGNFGGAISRELAQDARITVIIAGRSAEKGAAFARELAAANPTEHAVIDIRAEPHDAIEAARPDLVIHTVGPFQDQDYRVAEACIAAGVHYADLADARAFVAGIGALDPAARAADCLIVSGASSVPALTAAVIDEAFPRFSRLIEIDYGISAAQQTNRGLGTASAILSDIGRPFRQLRAGRQETVFGWQDLHGETYPHLGRRLFGCCDIPDLELFPGRYPDLRHLRFAAGHEIKSLHLATWLLSWLVRGRLLRSLQPWSEPLLKLSFLFDPLGSDESGMHMILRGQGTDGKQREERFFLIARQAHGPLVPCMPAIILARRLAAGDLPERGARPCLDLIDLQTYLGALGHLDIQVLREVSK